VEVVEDFSDEDVDVVDLSEEDAAGAAALLSERLSVR
jgi:hypothetical protein